MLPGKGMFIKEVDKKLPEWLVAAANRHEEIPLSSVIEMIRNWNNYKNEIFNFRVNSLNLLRFKASKREQ